MKAEISDWTEINSEIDSLSFHYSAAQFMNALAVKCWVTHLNYTYHQVLRSPQKKVTALDLHYNVDNDHTTDLNMHTFRVFKQKIGSVALHVVLASKYALIIHMILFLLKCLVKSTGEIWTQFGGKLCIFG